MIPTPTGLMPFAFEESLVRIRQDEHGNPWFVAKDVCAALSIENSFLAQRLTLVSDQLAELAALASSPLSLLGKQCLALRQAALAQECISLAQYAGVAAQPLGRATAQTGGEAAA